MNKVLKVFVLEDMKNDQELIKRQILKFNPNTVITIASDKASFYEKMSWVTPDIVISDFNLPDITGLDALFFIKKNFPLMPFLFVTGELNNEERVADTIIKGADGFLLKKNLMELPKLLERILNNFEGKNQKRKTIEQAARAKQLLIAKISNLFSKAPDYPGKENLQSLIQDLEKELNNPNSQD